MEYAEEEQDRLEHRAKEQGAMKRFRSFDDTNWREKEVPAKVPPEVTVVSDDDE